MLVEVAEISGKLPQSLKLLSQWYEFCDRLKHILISGLLLPATIITIAAPIFPLPYLILGQITFVKYFLQVLGTLAMFYIPAATIIAIYRLIPNTGLLRRILDTLIIKFPGLGQAIRQLALSRYCQTFNMLYEAGIPITKCAQKAAGITGNTVMADLLKGGAIRATGWKDGLGRLFQEAAG